MAIVTIYFSELPTTNITYVYKQKQDIISLTGACLIVHKDIKR